MCRTRYLIFTMVLKACNGFIIQGQPVGRYMLREKKECDELNPWRKYHDA